MEIHSTLLRENVILKFVFTNSIDLIYVNKLQFTDTTVAISKRT